VTTLRKSPRRPRAGRPLTYDIAVSEEFEHWRRWLDDQLGLMSAADADAFVRKLWLDESHWPSIFELAAGAALRKAGYDVAYERENGGLTPDWTALNGDGSPAMFVEVHTDQPGQGNVRAHPRVDHCQSRTNVAGNQIGA
jgi:hypothetical protein